MAGLSKDRLSEFEPAHRTRTREMEDARRCRPIRSQLRPNCQGGLREITRKRGPADLVGHNI